MVSYQAGDENLTANPSFEVDTAGWQGSGTSAIYSESNIPLYGSRSGMVVVSAVTGEPPRMQKAYDNWIPVSEGQVYQARAHVLSFWTTASFRLALFYFSPADAFLSVIYSDWITYPVTSVWQQLDITAIIPPGVGKVMLCTEAMGLNVGEQYRVDGVHEKVSSPIGEYVDGDQGPLFRWTETPHNSKSVKIATVLESARQSREGVIKFRPKVYRATKMNERKDDLSSHFVGGRVEMRSERSYKMAFRAKMQDANEHLDPYTDFLAPFLELEYPNGETEERQVGLYSIEPSAETLEETFRVADIEGIDITWELGTSIFPTPYTMVAGTNVVAAMRAILEGAGFTRHAIVNSSKVAATARTWERGATKLTVLNDMAEYIGYYSLFADYAGVVTSFPYREYASVEPAKRLWSGAGSQVLGAVRKTPSTAVVANVVRVVKQGTTVGDTIDVVRRNDNPDSPVSTVSLGREIYREIPLQEVVDVATAEAIADRALEEAGSLYTAYTIHTFPDIYRSVWEVYEADLYMTDGSPALQGKLRCSGWDLGFSTRDMTMVHYCNRLELI